MKKIKVALNQDSIRQAIYELKNYQKMVDVALNVFYDRCADYLIQKANTYLMASDIGEKVKADIQSSWYVEKIPKKGIRIVNNAEKAVFVEFGTGIVGGQEPHYNANEASPQGYVYNYPTGHKFADGSWVFFTNKDELDIPQSALIRNDLNIDTRYFNERDRDRTRLRVRTKGAVGVMYAFNALEDLRLEYPKIWEKVAKEYLD